MTELLSYATDDGSLVVSEAVVNTTVEFSVSSKAKVTEADSDDFSRDADFGLSVETSVIQFPDDSGVIVRDAESEDCIEEFGEGADGTVPAGNYLLEAISLPLKLYIRINDTTAIDAHDPIKTDGIELQFGEEISTEFFFRTLYNPPEGIIKTPPTVAGITKTISTLAGTIGADGPERSFATFREHPPNVELADDFSNESAVSPPDTDTQIYIPGALSAAYAVSTLAYYTSASVEIADYDAPVFESCGVTVSLGKEVPSTDQHINAGSIGEAAQTLLEHIFVLDCFVRDAEFEYGSEQTVDIAGVRDGISDDDISIDKELLAGLPVDLRIAEYLQLSIGSVSQSIDWPTAADVAPTPKSVIATPRLMNDLAEVRSPARSRFDIDEDNMGLIESFFEESAPEDKPAYRGSTSQVSDGPQMETSVAGRAGPPELSADRPVSDTVVSVDTDITAEGVSISPAVGHHQQHLSIERDYPIWSTRPTELILDGEAVSNVNRTAHDITGHVVANGTDIAEELRQYYEKTPVDSLKFEVDVTVDRLREIINEGCSFLHFEGHVSEEGIQCRDGVLDIESVSQSRVELFLLNGCSSYQQGEQLIRSGSYAGIVSTDTVLGQAAGRFGAACLSLLYQGFAVGPTLSIVRNELNAPPRYLILGDWQATVQSVGKSPTVAIVDGPGDERGEVLFRVVAYGGRYWGLGAVYNSRLLGDTSADHSGRLIGPQEVGPFSVHHSEFYRHLGRIQAVIVDSGLFVGDNMSIGIMPGKTSAEDATLEGLLRTVARTE